jgi:hypothetical protein
LRAGASYQRQPTLLNLNVDWLDTNYTTFYITCTKIPSTVSIKGRAQPKFVSEREKLLKLKQTRTSEEINEQITNRESQFKAEVNFS